MDRRPEGLAGLSVSRSAVAVLVAQAEDLLEEVAMIGRMAAGVGGRGAVKESGGVSLGTGAVGKQIGDLVELDQLHSARRREFLGIGILRQRIAFFMNSAQMGAAASAPSSLMSV